MPRPPVFGQDLAGLIASNMGPLMGDATLHHREPGARGADVSMGTNPVVTTFTCKAIKGKRRNKRGTPGNDGEAPSLIRTAVTDVTILGGTLPDDVTPEPGDAIDIDGETYVIEEVDATPGDAAFTCRCTGPS